MRPTRTDSLLEIAAVIAKRGTCDRKQVGAVIARDGRPISWGYNGAPPGLPHCAENDHGWGIVHHEEGKADLRELSPQALEKFQSYPRQDALPWDYNGGIDWLCSHHGCRNATHAEANALAFAARQGISTDEAELYVTVAPCDTCARLVIAAGIICVHYLEEYRDRSGIELLAQAGVRRAHHISPHF